MAPSITSQSGAIKLVFDPKTRLPGEVIEGVVELDVGLARKEGVSAIGLKLRGVATTYVLDFRNDSFFLPACACACADYDAQEDHGQHR
jgi:hypothetical protein